MRTIGSPAEVMIQRRAERFNRRAGEMRECAKDMGGIEVGEKPSLSEGHGGFG